MCLHWEVMSASTEKERGRKRQEVGDITEIDSTGLVDWLDFYGGWRVKNDFYVSALNA